jgi:signal peptidase
MKKAIRFLISFQSFISSFLLGCLLATAIVFWLEKPLSLKVFAVNSGSMAPAVPLGSLVIIKKADAYDFNDVITFKGKGKSKQAVTHRVVGVVEDRANREVGYRTKGDANSDPDPELINSGRVLGKVALKIPFLGYLVSFTKTKLGFFLLIIIPAGVIVFTELLNIINELKKMSQRKKAVGPAEKIIAMAIFLFLFAPLLAFFIPASQAYFYDQEKGNFGLTAGVWGQPRPPCCQLPKIFCHLDEAKTNLFFEVQDIAGQFDQIIYQLTYQSGEAFQGVKGGTKLADSQFFREIFLGTCSGEDCLVHEDISDFKLEVSLLGSEGETAKLEPSTCQAPSSPM